MRLTFFCRRNCTRIILVFIRPALSHRRLQAPRKTVTDEENKSGLDEQTFQKLLEAASVLQKHNRGIRQTALSPEPHGEQFRGQEPATEDTLRDKRSAGRRKPTDHSRLLAHSRRDR